MGEVAVTVTEKQSGKLWWPLPAVLLVLSITVYFLITSYQFFALIGAGVSLLIAAYRLLGKLIRRKPTLGKALRLILSVCIGLGLLAAAVTGCFVAKGCYGAPEADCRYIVVLGAGVNGTEPSLSLRERIDAAYDYLTAHPGSIAIVSGGQGDGENITEALCMQRELLEMGIAGSRIWMEDEATSTQENIRFSLDLIEANTGARPAEIALVSSEYHLFRAGLFARDAGVTALGVPAKTSWLSLRLNYFLREIAAVWYYCLF